jgi:transposase
MKMRRYLETQCRWLQVVRLPSYAPEVNPVEGMWTNISGQELANRSVDGLGEMLNSVQRGLSRVKSRRKLLQSFLHHAGIFF